MQIVFCKVFLRLAEFGPDLYQTSNKLEPARCTTSSLPELERIAVLQRDNQLRRRKRLHSRVGRPLDSGVGLILNSIYPPRCRSRQ